MRDLVKNMLGLGITVGLSDREEFVKQVAGLIETYQKDPEKAGKWATGIVAYLEGVRDNINVQSAVKDVMRDEALNNKERLEELVKAVKELSKDVKELKEK